MLCNDDTWNSFPGYLTNAADVLANGAPPVYRGRPDFPKPAAHANNAASAVVSIYKQALDKHVAYTLAKAALTAALLEATMYPVPVYSLSPRQIVEAMFTKHGQTTGPDLQNFGIRSLKFCRLWLSLRLT
jgi:hypothetical protein